MDRSGIGAAQPDGGSTTVSSTGCTSEVERLMTFSTSAGRGLVFEQFLEVTRAGLQFVEQPRILDRDHRLRGEIFEQRDLLVGERPDLGAIARRCSRAMHRFGQRHQKARPHPATPRQRCGPLVTIQPRIGDVHMVAPAKRGA